MKRFPLYFLLFSFLFCLSPTCLEGSVAHQKSLREGKSLSDLSIQWPRWEKIERVLFLKDYNTRIVFAGAIFLCAAAGLVGTFLLLRKRSLLSDTVSHATLPGIALAFLIAESLGGEGRSLPLLLGGAALFGVLGMGCVVGICRWSFLKDDLALAIVLSVFFGLGISLTVIIQQLPTGNAAGINHYIYGKAASMTSSDAQVIIGVALLIALISSLFFKEFALLCFDENFAASQGWPVTPLDLLLMSLVVAVTVIGLQAVGLLLIVAMLIIPPASARFWSHHLLPTTLLSTALGALSGWLGVTLSALFPKLPTGAIIVLAASFFFALSMIFGRQRGMLIRFHEYRRIKRRVERQHILRAFYEVQERQALADPTSPLPLLERPILWDDLLMATAMTLRQFQHLLRRAEKENLLMADLNGRYRLTRLGQEQAQRIVRNHRLWELYLIEYADVAPAHVHHDADLIEHVVDKKIVHQLENLLKDYSPQGKIPENPEKSYPL